MIGIFIDCNSLRLISVNAKLEDLIMHKSYTSPFEDRIAVIYKHKDAATDAKSQLINNSSIPRDVIDVVSPQHTSESVASSLEERSSELGRNMLSSHLWFGAAGVLTAILLALVLVNIGPAFFANNPFFTVLAFAIPGFFIGTFIAGIKALKPQHDRLNRGAIAANKQRHWLLLIEKKASQKYHDKIMDILDNTSYLRLYH